jgi:hypothetical protein
MSVHSLSPDGDHQHSVTTHITPRPSRSLLLRYRLRYAEKGIQTSPADVANKKPHLKGWQKKATTSPQQITAEANRWPDAGILTPTGRAYERWVLDVDSFEDLVRLEEILGVQLSGISTEVQTQNGHLQIHFSWPEGLDVRNSVGKKLKDGFEGLDVKGEGGLILLPPSAGYSFANDLPMVEAPPELVEWATSRTRSQRRGDDTQRRREVDAGEGEIVEEGGRNDDLFDRCRAWRDAGLSPEEGEAKALAYNEKWYRPALSEAEVVRTAQSAYSRPPQRRGPDPEAERIGEAAWRNWWEELVPHGGRSKLRDSARVLLENALEHPNVVEVVTEDGEVRKALVSSISYRQGGPRAGTSHMSFGRAMKKLEEAGKLLRSTSNDERHEDPSQTWLILDPATNCYTPSISPRRGEDAEGVTPCRGPEMTPCFRWRHPVGNAGGGVLGVAEVYGEETAEEMAERAGYSRVRDFRRMRLDPLVERGDLVERDGVYAISEDYERRMAEELNEPYSVTIRRRTSVDPSGMETHWVEYGPEKSDVEREAEDLERYEDQRRKRREFLGKKRTWFQEPSNAPDELLEVPTNLAPEDAGETPAPNNRLAPGEWVDPETGEVLNSDEAGEPEPVASSSTGQVLPFGDLGRLYPLVDHRVLTDEGPGVLWQVFGDRVGVLLDERPGEVTFLPPAAVLEGEAAA